MARFFRGLGGDGRAGECHVTGLDWGAVVALARENAAAAGMADRYNTIVGSAFEVPWGEGYDLLLVPNFLHHFDRAACTGLLHRARAALAPGGRVAMVEWIPNEDRVSPPAPALFAMTMVLTTPTGTTYTAVELAAMPGGCRIRHAHGHPADTHALDVGVVARSLAATKNHG